jgi:DMSO reductase anchor subunit
VLLGAAGVFASGSIYRVGSRPAWNTPYTPVQFGFTAAVLGPLFAGAIGVGSAWWLAMASVGVGTAQLLLLAVRFLRLIAADSLELRGTARLLSTVLRPAFITRLALVVAGAIVLPLLATQTGGPQWLIGMRPVFAAALLVAVAGEIVGRYLFFVSVVPMHMTAPYVAGAKEAA